MFRALCVPRIVLRFLLRLKTVRDLRHYFNTPINGIWKPRVPDTGRPLYKLDVDLRLEAVSTARTEEIFRMKPHTP